MLELARLTSADGRRRGRRRRSGCSSRLCCACACARAVVVLGVVFVAAGVVVVGRSLPPALPVRGFEPLPVQVPQRARMMTWRRTRPALVATTRHAGRTTRHRHRRRRRGSHCRHSRCHCRHRTGRSSRVSHRWISADGCSRKKRGRRGRNMSSSSSRGRRSEEDKSRGRRGTRAAAAGAVALPTRAVRAAARFSCVVAPHRAAWLRVANAAAWSNVHWGWAAAGVTHAELRRRLPVPSEWNGSGGSGSRCAGADADEQSAVGDERAVGRRAFFRGTHTNTTAARVGVSKRRREMDAAAALLPQPLTIPLAALAPPLPFVVSHAHWASGSLDSLGRANKAPDMQACAAGWHGEVCGRRV